MNVNENLQEEIYMEEFFNYIQNDFSFICRVKKFLYGLK